jgi:hypothetical protein
VENAPYQRRSDRVITIKTLHEPSGLTLLEVREFYTRADVERRRQGVVDQVRRRSYPCEAERKSLELRVFRAACIAVANRGEELVRGERQALRYVDLVQEDDDATVDPLKHDAVQRLEKPLHGRETLVCLPEVVQLVL